MKTNAEIKKVVPQKIVSSSKLYFRILICGVALLLLCAFLVWNFIQLIYKFYSGFAPRDIVWVIFFLLMVLMALGYCVLLCLSLFRCWKWGYLDWGTTRFFKSTLKGPKTASHKPQSKET